MNQSTNHVQMKVEFTHQSFQEEHAMVSLDLSQQILDLSRITEFLRHSQLVTLNLSRTSLTPRDANLLFQSLPYSLEHLILANNQLGDQGIADLLSAKFLFRLKTLDLSNNGITSEGALLLSHHLISKSNSLKRLDISNNFIGAEGIKSVAMSLTSTSKSLMQLHLQGNHGELSPSSKECLLNMLGENSHLRELSHNVQEPEYEAQIEYYLNMNRYGRFLLKSYDLNMALWPGILAKAASLQPSLLHALVNGRPDIFTPSNLDQ